MTGTELWTDVSGLDPDRTSAALARIRQSAADAVVVRRDQLKQWERLDRIAVAWLVEDDVVSPVDDEPIDLVLAGSPALLPVVRDLAGERPVGVRCEIVDHATMDEAAALCGSVDVLVAAFVDTTNIPLELLVATAQGTRTRVVKELLGSGEVAAVAGVLEVGPAGLLLGGDDLADLPEVAAEIGRRRELQRDLVPLEVIRAEPVGMGHRGCIDTTTLFQPDEGMIIGSTSSGGILVCAEVHYLPYMNLRPFRVNAGAVHSYVFGAERTAYITDLKAGEPVHAVSASGRFRDTLVGRVKVELRPLRLIEARHGDTTVNVLLQDDWHVRVMGAKHEPLNLTDVRPGTELLGHVCAPGRHVGIKVSEQIDEF